MFCFDSDEAGLKAAWRALQITVSYSIDDKTVRFMFLPKGEDPDSYINKKGPNEFLKELISPWISNRSFLTSSKEVEILNHQKTFD